ncbi:hypothetical protein Tcan_08284 [Toxocara canis]|uniref:Uncharacterized protein n=1 Tax=Toxocara canis TaxID=6265 RepID=A0A0B2V7S3_TOXCA|nr:hypothetical protein Tcan_08284 [Toxocara canis]
MKSSTNDEGLTSLISYAPHLPFVDIHASLTQNQARTLTETRCISPPLEVVSARQNTLSTHGSTTRLPSPPRRQSTPATLVPIRPALQRSRRQSSSGGIAVSSSDKKEEETKGGLTEGKEGVLARATGTLNPLKKKKTVAFGRTVNVSQTVEGNKMRRKSIIPHVREQKNSTKVLNEEEVSSLKKEVRELKQLVNDIMKKDHEHEEKIVKLEKKGLEQERQMLELSDMVKEFMKWASPKRERSRERLLTASDEKYCEKKVEMRRRHSGKENIPPQEGKQQKLDEGEVRKLILRKWEESDAFRRHVEQGLMEFGGDHSLDVIAGIQPRSRPMQRRVASPDHDGGRLYEGNVGQAPMLKATRVTKQTTVEQIRCVESPARSNAFSLDSRKYLARYGISGAVDDEDDRDGGKDCVSRATPPLESVYEPGRSVTYYPSHGRYNREPDPLCTSHRTVTRTPQQGAGYEVWEGRRNIHGSGSRARRCHTVTTRPGKLEYDEAAGSSDELLNDPLDLDDEVLESQDLQSERGTNAILRDSPVREERRIRNAEKHRAERRRNRVTNC